MMERISVRDQPFRLAEGWHFVVSGRVHGVFATEEAATREMQAQQQAEYDLRNKRRGT